MAFSRRWKAELVISVLISVEFFGVTIWAFLTQKNNIFVLCAVLMGIGFVFTFLKVYEAKFPGKKLDDERLEKFTEQAYLISAIAGIIMLIQLAILEIVIDTTISTLNAFFIVTNTFLFVFLIVEFYQYYILS